MERLAKYAKYKALSFLFLFICFSGSPTEVNRRRILHDARWLNLRVRTKTDLT